MTHNNNNVKPSLSITKKAGVVTRNMKKITEEIIDQPPPPVVNTLIERERMYSEYMHRFLELLHEAYNKNKPLSFLRFARIKDKNGIECSAHIEFKIRVKFVHDHVDYRKCFNEAVVSFDVFNYDMEGLHPIFLTPSGKDYINKKIGSTFLMRILPEDKEISHDCGLNVFLRPELSDGKQLFDFGTSKFNNYEVDVGDIICDFSGEVYSSIPRIVSARWYNKRWLMNTWWNPDKLIVVNDVKHYFKMVQDYISNKLTDGKFDPDKPLTKEKWQEISLKYGFALEGRIVDHY